MATVKAMRTSVRRTTASSHTTTGTTRTTSSSQCTTSTPTTTLTSTIVWCTSCVETARIFVPHLMMTPHTGSSSERVHSRTPHGSSPESFNNHLQNIHGAPSLTRFSLSTSSSCSSPSFSFYFLHSELYSEFDNPTAMESLRYSANKESEDAYDVSTSLTGYEPKLLTFGELNDSSVPLLLRSLPRTKTWMT